MNDIEVTQGVQNLVDYTATDAASGPRTRIFGAPRTVGLPEVDMRSGAKTVVRVYANLRGGDAGGAANVPATLEGVTAAGTRLGTLQPDARPAVLRIGDAVTDMSERLDPAGAYTFTLPEKWALIGKLDLIARVNPAGIDCDDACQRRSTFRLNGVKFRETIRGCSVRTGGGRPRPACDTNYGVNIWPVAMLNRGVRPIMNGSPMGDDPGPAFEMARLLTPANLIVWPWMGQMDASGIENGTQVKQESCFLGIELGITCTDDTIQLLMGTVAERAASRKLLEGIILDNLERMKEDRNIGDSVVLEALRGRPGSRNGGQLPGAMRGKYLEDQEDDPEDVGGRGYADVGRPIGAVAHELHHALGRRHAGGDPTCYPDPKQKGEDWPEPTNRGALIGTGLDLRPRSGGFRGPYRIISPGVLGLASPLGDLMSYCIGAESQIWISTVGWNQILNYRGIAPSPASARAPVHVAQTASGALIRVTAVELDDGRLVISGIQPTRGRTNAANPAAEYQLQARDAQGKILASSPGSAQTSDDTGATVIVGAVPRPSGTASIVVAHGTRAARVQKSANAPKIRLLSPRGGKIKAKRVPIRWRATDADDDDLTATIDFSINGGRTWRALFVGANSGSHKLPMALLARSRNARVRVRVDDGFGQASAVSKRLSVTGPKPLVRLQEPVRNQRIRADAPLRLSARAFGDFGKPLGFKAIRWFDGRRKLGVGTALTVSGLRAGRHTIKAVAKAGGRTGSASVKISVIGVKPAFLALDAPARVSRRARKLRLRVASTVTTRLTIGRKRYTVGQRAKRVTVKLKPGKSALKLKLRLGSGRLSTSQQVTIARR